MAATRLIALHINKGKTVAQCLADRTDYSENAAKTNNGEFISSYGCDPKTADEEFLLSKRQYEYATGRKQKRDVIAYQIRQSFKPGEITPEKANEVGYELAMRFTKGQHAFIVATHVDKAHIHNHIIFNSTTLDCKHKNRFLLRAGLAMQKLSDIICLENGLSVIKPKPYHERVKRTVYPKKKSIRDQIRADIDQAMEQKPKEFAELVGILKNNGYEYKDGSNPALRKAEQKRFVRFSSLGEGYSVEELKMEMAGKIKTRGKSLNGSRQNNKKFDMLINIQEKIGEGKNGGYVNWAKRFNVKQASKAIVFLQEHGIHSMEELQEKTKQVSAEFDQLDKDIKSAEKRLAEIAVLRTHIINYSKTRDVYTAYRKSGYNRKFFEENREAITLHKAAKKAFDELGVDKIPKVKDLSVEYAEVLEKKKADYAKYRSVRQEMKDYQMAQEIAKTFLEEPDTEPEKRERKNQSQEK